MPKVASKRGRSSSASSASWRERSAGTSSRCNSLERIGLCSPSSYTSYLHFYEVVGIDFVQYQVNARSKQKFSVVHGRGFDIGSLLNIAYLDRDGQAACTSVLTSILAGVCSQLEGSGIKVNIKHEPIIPLTGKNPAKFGDILVYKPLDPTLQPYILLEVKVKEVDTPPVQIMVGAKALFAEYKPDHNIMCVVVYGGYVADIYEVDCNLIVHRYNRINLVVDDGHRMAFNEEGTQQFIAILTTYILDN